MNPLNAIIAQAVLDVPMSDTLKTLIGLIGIMVLIITVLTCVLLIKRVFGRTPPLETEFKKLRSEIYETSNRAKKELTKDISDLNERSEKIENEIEEIKLDRERKWNELRKEYHGLELTIAKMLGRFDEVLNQLKNK
jgi:predicted nuclease with TOPRIM domain